MEPAQNQQQGVSNFHTKADDKLDRSSAELTLDEQYGASRAIVLQIRQRVRLPECHQQVLIKVVKMMPN